MGSKVRARASVRRASESLQRHGRKENNERAIDDGIGADANSLHLRQSSIELAGPLAASDEGGIHQCGTHGDTDDRALVCDVADDIGVSPG